MEMIFFAVVKAILSIATTNVGTVDKALVQEGTQKKIFKRKYIAYIDLRAIATTFL
jgi:hypothetical protein